MIRADLGDAMNAAALDAPPDATPMPPVVSLSPTLPFGELSWENFERLCYRLAGAATRVEAVQRYGRQGQNQQGIDIFVRLEAGAYEVWQVKRYARFRKSDLARVLTAFRRGSWADRSSALIVAVQAALDDVALQEAIEVAAAELRSRGIRLEVLGGDELSGRLRAAPRLVHDFFGRGWTEAFLGGMPAELVNVLDGAELAKVRDQIRRVYRTQFTILDQGIVGPLVLSTSAAAHQFGLLDRYTEPDVIRREQQLQDGRESMADPSNAAGADASAPRRGPARTERSRRFGVETWALEGERLALVGDAGLGKSTFLRALALDLLGEQTTFPRLAQKWGSRLPLVIPFARWARATAAAGGHVGLKDIIRGTWQALLTADLVGLLDRAIDEGRVLLLVDGLDEWADEQAARTALATVLTLAGAHDIPAVVTGRPRGLQKIGSLPAGWRTAELAPLSSRQRQDLARRWFAQHLAASSDEPPAAIAIELETTRFFQGLQQEPGLLELSETPLLLLALVGLALRNHALPRNRVQALERLVETLIEEHPQRRATAAGDAVPRFEVLADADVRRGALAALALASRLEGGDAGSEKARLRRIVTDHLTTAEGFAGDAARRGADELLAVNAETVGLLIEKGPGEIGFAHASLEEYLAARALLRRPLVDLVAFVSARCGEPRWRNVFSDLAALIVRPDELDQLVAAIEAATLDPLGAATRDHLLALIAFGSPGLSTGTATRLAEACFETIEAPGWMEQRRRLLASVQRGLSRPSLSAMIEARLGRWVPRRSKYASTYFDALARLPPTEDVFQLLLRALGAEDYGDRIAAARVLGRCYAAWPLFHERLTEKIAGGNDHDAVGAALLALVEARPDHPETIEHAETALRSKSDLLRAVGLFARVRRGVHTDADREAALEFGRELPVLNEGADGVVQTTLIEGWPDDPRLVELALDALSHRGEVMDRDAAFPYLMRCTPRHPKLVAWIEEQLEAKYPLNLSPHERWAWLEPFARAEPAILEKLVAALHRDEHGMYDHYAWPLVARLGDTRLRDLAIERVRDGKYMRTYWNLLPLLDGWRGDGAVERLIAEIAEWPDERIGDILGLLPQIIADPAVCRRRLLNMQEPENGWLRYDFLADGLIALGGDHRDEDAVDKLLGAADRVSPAYDPEDRLIRAFGAHPRVRAFALRRLRRPSPPIAAMLDRYADDLEFRPELLHYGEALPTTLRYPLAQAARTDGERRASSAVALREYDLEVDCDLKVTLAIGHYEVVASEGAPPPETVDALLRDARAVGADNEERRAAAFAGLVVLSAADRFLDLSEGGGPLRISTGSVLDPSAALLQLIAERWDDLASVMGQTLLAQLGRFSGKPCDVWETLAPYVASSAAASRDFLGYCEEASEPLGEGGLRALSTLRPRTALLERHCWHTLEHDERYSDLHRARARLEAVRILTEQFPGRADVVERLKAGARRPRLPDARMLGLALYDPTSDVVSSVRLDDEALGDTDLDWPTLMHIASQTQSAARFVELGRRMLHRQRHSPWDLQQAMNAVMAARLQRDETAAAMIADEVLGEQVTVTGLASWPRLLASTGKLPPAIRERCLEVLERELASRALPHVGFDVVADRFRTLPHSLADALTETGAV